MIALRLSFAHSVRAFGLIPSAGKEFYDRETTIERGYPFHLFSIYRTHAHELAGTCSFPHHRISACISAGALFTGPLHWATSLGHFTACIGSMGTLFACNLGSLYSLLYCIIKVTPYSFIHI